MAYQIPDKIMEQYIGLVNKYLPGYGKGVVEGILPQFDLTKDQRFANERIVSTIQPFVGAVGASELERKLNEIKISNASKSL